MDTFVSGYIKLFTDEYGVKSIEELPTDVLIEEKNKAAYQISLCEWHRANKSIATNLYNAFADALEKKGEKVREYNLYAKVVITGFIHLSAHARSLEEARRYIIDHTVDVDYDELEGAECEVIDFEDEDLEDDDEE